MSDLLENLIYYHKSAMMPCANMQNVSISNCILLCANIISLLYKTIKLEMHKYYNYTVNKKLTLNN